MADMTSIHVRTDIGRPADEVFAFLADMENNTTWQKGMQSCRWTSDPPLRLGSTYDQVAAFLGKEMVTSFEVTEFVDPERIRIESRESTMPLDITRTVEAVGMTSVVEAHVQGEPQGFMRVLGPLLDLMVKRSVTADYRRLKEHLEA
jgi:uncharacterized membrane protein